MSPLSLPPDGRLQRLLSLLTCSPRLSNCTTSHDTANTQTPMSHDRQVRSKGPRYISHPRHLRRNVENKLTHVYIHPINYLPVEMLLLIFEIGSAEHEFFPILVSQVCKSWRHLVLQTPFLWRYVTLGSKAPMLRERLRRAKDCPLDIQLTSFRLTPSGNRRYQDLNPYTVNWFLQLAQPYGQQWRSLNIHLVEYSPYLWRAAMAACNHPVPLLEELSFVYRLNDDTQEFLPFSGYAPRLRRLTVDGIRLTWSPYLFANLTYLNYTHHGLTSGHHAVYDVISILSVSSRLVHFRVLFPRGQISRIPSCPQVDMKPAILPYLKQLQLTTNGSDIPFEIARLVASIVTPNLNTLRLVDLSCSHQPFPSLKSFFYVYALPRSLRFVSVGHGWHNPDMIHAMYHSLPNLVSIHVERTRNADQFLRMRSRLRQTPSLSASARQPDTGNKILSNYYNDYNRTLRFKI